MARSTALGQENGGLHPLWRRAAFPQWGTLTSTWAKRGHQPTVKTSGIRKGYKVFGMVEYFSGRFFSQGHAGRFTSESYAQFLESVLQQTTQPIILIQDGARYHTSKAPQEFFAQHVDRLTVYQLPSYSPDYNPIEKLWKKIKELDCCDLPCWDLHATLGRGQIL